MLHFHDPIPELAGQTCTALLAQEYWFGSDPVSSANVLFLQCNDRFWHRLFIDAGVVFWRMSEEAPQLPPDGKEQRYLLTDLGQRVGLCGRIIAAVHSRNLPGGGEIHLGFVQGTTVLLRDVDDRTELEIFNAGEGA